MSTDSKVFELAYQQALKFSRKHYENFPVASLFLPKELRKHVAIVYLFARQADDIADEGVENAERRTQNLEYYEDQLRQCFDRKPANDFWMALKNIIDKYNITNQLFFDLLSAFKQDIVKSRYQNYEELLDYCRRSANPVGRIILEFFNIRDDESISYSDAICTALQLTNFYQDISIDLQNNRIYIPLDEILKFGLTEKMFELRENNANFKQLLKYQVDRTKELFEKGRGIIPLLPKSLKLQIKLTILGGEMILKKIEKLDYNTLIHRPTVSKTDLILIFRKAINW